MTGRVLRRDELSPRVSMSFVAGATTLVVLAGFGLLGTASAGVLAAMPLVSMCVLSVGVWRNRPRPMWAFVCMTTSSVFFVTAAVARDALGAKGDISAYQTLTPDFFSLPGYALFAASIVGLLRARRRKLGGSGLASETAMLAIGSFVIAWVVLIGPVLAQQDLPAATKISFSMYPPFSAFLAALAARLVFIHGKRFPSHRLFMSGMLAMLVGDVIYFLSDTKLAEPPANLIDLPYGLAFALIAGAMLHPTVAELSRPVEPSQHSGGRDRARIATVALPLLVAPLLITVWNPANVREQLVVGGLVLVMTGMAIIRLLTAMTSQSASEARFAYLAMHDELTGLPNRPATVRRLQEMLDTDGTDIISIFLVDLDHFKLVNDSLGHNVGDRLLRAAATRLSGAIEPGHWAARVSGDEFVVVATSRTEDQAIALGEHIRQAFTQPLDIGAEVFSTVSIGVAMTRPQSGRSPAGLISDADNAMYRSKDSGRNAVTVFDIAMRENVARRMQLEADLRRALNDNLLQVHYQPIVSLVSGRVESFEALVRWPVGSTWVSPAEFIPVAEDTGLIVPLGAMVLHESCRQLSRWRRRPGWSELSISVNVSARQLRSSDFVALVANVLDSTGLPGEALWLEITESMMMQDTDEMLDRLEAIRALGVRFSIDDFGTGFSSLSYLQRFPIDRVKIDRSFVIDLAHSDDRSLARAIIAIARSLDMETIAEGIETETQLVALAEMGCRRVQGFFIAKPMAPDAVERRVIELDEHPITEILPSVVLHEASSRLRR
jgi:diguanylate cyclase (GGDEF)-like protein